MPQVLADLAPEVARLLKELTGIDVAVSDARGKALAHTAPDWSYCPLFVRDDDRAPPLPPHCEDCPRVEALLARDLERLVACPYAADAVRVLSVNGAPAGSIVLALSPTALAPVLARAKPALRLAELLLEAAIAADRRERLARELLGPRLEASLSAADHALAEIRGAPDEAPDRDGLELLRGSIDRARDVLAALRAAPRPVAEVLSRAADDAAGWK